MVQFTKLFHSQKPPLKRLRFFSFPLVSLVVCFLSLSGCARVTIQPSPLPRVLQTNQTYESSKHFFLWGIVGEEHVNAEQICEGKKIVQMQTETTFLDGFLGLVTFGIYSPRTVKVWCD